MMNLFGSKSHGRLSILLSALLAILCVSPAVAFQFNLGDINGSLDSTLSYGASWRVEKRDKAIIGIDNGGTAYSVNADDGNLNYDRGDLISSAVKITSDLALDHNNFGLFMRGSAFYDFEYEQGDRARSELTNEALDLVGSDIDLLDAYAWWNFNAGEALGQIRLGQQVLSWGESTFIQNGINVINPFDVSKLRVPGSELKEALVPVGMISASISPAENLTFEAFYQYDWENVEIDPVGSYWSTSDGVGVGGSRFMLGWGTVPDDFPVATNTVVQRGETVEADDDGQYGLAMRLYVPELNETELGFYFINYHSRLPTLNAQTAPVLSGTYVQDSRYFTKYPEDIKLYGLSFNTTFDATGIALQGEYSFKQDMPLQIDEIELLFGALSPTNPALGLFGQLGAFSPGDEVQGYKLMDVSQVQMTASKLFGPTLGADQFVLLGEVGWTHVHNMPSKDELRFDGPGTFISGNRALALGGAQRDILNNPITYYEDDSHYADADSWGYRLIGKMDFNNAIGAVTLSPRIGWNHDVSGITPGPGGNFIEDRKAITFGLGASYQSTWSADLSYTEFFGAGRYNLVNDRDFIALNIKYSF